MLPEYPDSTMRALARNVLVNTLRLRRGENLLIETWSSTLPWAERFVLEARILGVRPLLVVEDEETFWRSVEEAPGSNVGSVGSHDWAALKSSHAYMYFWGPLAHEREEKLPRAIVNHIVATDHEWFRLVEKYGIRVARWDLGRTNEVWAKRYGVDLETWRRELIEAASADPRPLQRDGRKVADALQRGHEVRITHQNGTDLTLHLVGRQPHVDDGIVDDADIRAGNVMAVVPSGVTSVAVDETFADGTFIAGEPAGVLFAHGIEFPIRGGRWRFRKGRLVEYSFEGGQETFRREYSKVGAGKDRPGLLSVGLNPRTTSIPLLFDQELGTVTVAVGRNAHVGGATRSPRFSAYQSVRKASVEVDGRLVVDRGAIL